MIASSIGYRDFILSLSIMHKLVVFAHGQESGPWGTKITALAEAAQALGWAVESTDYRVLPDKNDPDARVAHLLALRPQAVTKGHFRRYRR